jgi:hypothetical protein
LGQDQRLDVLHVVQCNDGIDRIGLKRQVSGADDGSIATRQNTLHFDRVGTFVNGDPAGRILVVDIGQRDLAVNEDVYGWSVSGCMQHLYCCARCRKIDRRRIVVIRVACGKNECARDDD